ncbi:hypothetical protein, partial [Bacteroides heparinolyticus]|uniref:hypothetical protein n=1 Tax=Prevotella heparinolytica TaxID=28113 RepID=UPI00359FC840
GTDKRRAGNDTARNVGPVGTVEAVAHRGRLRADTRCERGLIGARMASVAEAESMKVRKGKLF